MNGIRIRLLGEVAYENLIKLETGYRCDVPTDDLGIPFLPIAPIFEESGLFASIPDIIVGFARPDGYLGLIREAGRLAGWPEGGSARIRDLYTREHYYPDRGCHIRSLRKGLMFYAPVYVPEDMLEKADEFVRKIKRIGIREEGISGAVACSICDLNDEISGKTVLSDLLTYSSVEYSMVLMSPACIYAPFEGGSKTYRYLPGAEVRKAMTSLMEEGPLKDTLSRMLFSNAYISEGTTRLLPMPLCMSVVKLDKEQLRYRLASGKDPARVEQDLAPENAYCAGFEDHFIEYVKPVVERIVTSDGERFDTLSEGQVFRGIIYGTDAQIRKVAGWIRTHPYMRIGNFTQEGYGEAYTLAEALKEDPITAQTLSSCFDVSCLSHTVLINDKGMTVCAPEDLLSEIEYRLGIPGRLKIAGMYTDVYRDFSDRYGWNREAPVIHCLKMGSVLRIRTKDGMPVDISGILHTFIGEHTGDGYGEIMSWPAREGYYRIAKQNEPCKYHDHFPVSRRNLHIGAYMVHKMLTGLLRERVRGLALADIRENPDIMSREANIPGELLEKLRQTYDPTVSIKTLKRWYVEELYREGVSDARNSY